MPDDAFSEQRAKLEQRKAQLSLAQRANWLIARDLGGDRLVMDVDEITATLQRLDPGDWREHCATVWTRPLLHTHMIRLPRLKRESCLVTFG